MTDSTVKFIFLIVAVFVMLLSIRRGYRRGIARELRMFISVIIAMLCLVLIIVLKHAVSEHTYGTAVVIAGALIILGTGWRIIKVIIGPLSGFRELGVVRAADAFLGAIAGAAEGALILVAAMKIYTLIQG